jgi:transcriptional regulator with GAF, ATPase, and Fis domain
MAEIRERRIWRDDFFYRICSDVIMVPPLARRIAENASELKLLLGHTVQRILGRPSPELVGRLHGKIIDQLGIDYPWPGNVRELEQCVRRLLVSEHYAPFQLHGKTELEHLLMEGIAKGEIDAQTLIAGYCYLLYERHGTYEAVSQRVQLDRRTAKKYIQQGLDQFGQAQTE